MIRLINFRDLDYSNYFNQIVEMFRGYNLYHSRDCGGFDIFINQDPNSLNNFMAWCRLERLVDNAYTPNSKGMYHIGAIDDQTGELVGFLQFVFVKYCDNEHYNMSRVLQFSIDTLFGRPYDISNVVRPDCDIPCCSILFLYVNEEYRNLHIAKMLYDEMERICYNNEVYRIFTSIASTNGLSLNFHDRMGFKLFLDNGRYQNSSSYQIVSAIKDLNINK